MMDPLEHLQMLKDSAAGIAPRKGDLKRIRALRFTEPASTAIRGARCAKWAGSACASRRMAAAPASARASSAAWPRNSAPAWCRSR